MGENKIIFSLETMYQLILLLSIEITNQKVFFLQILNSNNFFILDTD